MYTKYSFKGFTLVELIIVITILAILSTTAFVSFQVFSKKPGMQTDGLVYTLLKKL